MRGIAALAILLSTAGCDLENPRVATRFRNGQRYHVFEIDDETFRILQKVQKQACEPSLAETLQHAVHLYNSLAGMEFRDNPQKYPPGWCEAADKERRERLRKPDAELIRRLHIEKSDPSPNAP